MRYGLIALAAAGVFGVSAGTASARGCGDGWNIDEYGRCIPGYMDDRPAPPPANYGGYYGDGYRGGYHAPPSPPYYRGGYYRQRQSGGDNPCPPYWTIQNGACKPYRGH